jgi:hypothetical protein
MVSTNVNRLKTDNLMIKVASRTDDPEHLDRNIIHTLRGNPGTLNALVAINSRVVDKEIPQQVVQRATL